MDEKEIRAQIDTENVKGLLLINGGGSVALLAFLPSILDKPKYEILTVAILWGLFLFQIGLAATLIHNHLRRRCSLAYQCNIPKVKFMGFGLAEPWICHFSYIFMIISYICFISAGILIFQGGIKAFDKNKKTETKCASTQKQVSANSERKVLDTDKL
ncbi:MAG: hypothetical protein WC571_01635 [Candidatus Omnitrophota bacterium]